MIVRRAAGLTVALVLGITLANAAPKVEADPHELYDRACEFLADGELRAAATSLSRLKSLIADRPDWDPEGVFAKELLPPLSDRLSRLQGASRRLDEFTVQSLEDLEPPDIKKDISTVRDYTEWATTVIERLRGERDRIIASSLSNPEERAFLTHTESYVRTERLLEVEVLKRMADTAGDDILGLLGGDPELESVLVRFRQLKRELMKIVADRDQLEGEVKESHERGEAVLRVLAALVTDDTPLESGPGGRKSANVATLFPRFLDGKLTAMRARASLTPSELEAFRADLDRYTRYNRVLHEAGIGPDQGPRIDALAKAVHDLPVDAGDLKAFSAVGPACLLLIGALTLATGFAAWLAITRGRRLASLHRSASVRLPITAAETHGSDADRHAV
ncbi:MAG TPA: hypothetical protein VGV60_13200 [Candidatus Polarisedimenticolia bacterium]|jgi:hypothetical protein|nr:hypothetical protein [Candidatus Polarisedimenticolia bacterium]